MSTRAVSKIYWRLPVVSQTYKIMYSRDDARKVIAAMERAMRQHRLYYEPADRTKK